MARKQRNVLLSLTAGLLFLPLWVFGSPLIAPDEVVVMFPTTGHRSAGSDGWHLDIHGWVYEPSRSGDWAELNRMLLGTQAIYANERGGDDDESLLSQRTGLFAVDNQRGKEVIIGLGGESYRMPASEAYGHFRGSIQVSDQQLGPILKQIDSDKTGLSLPLRVALLAGDGRYFGGRIHLVEEQGLSVISDLDDTIKDSSVLDTPQLLANTFAREFRPVPGMAEVYRDWAAIGAAFHYLSASPWQLY